MPTAKSHSSMVDDRCTQVLRDEIGTAMSNKKSLADQFSLIIRSQRREGGCRMALKEKRVLSYL